MSLRKEAPHHPQSQSIAIGDQEVAATFCSVAAISIGDFARNYSLCRASVYNEINEGRLTACKIGGKTVILRQDAETWVANLPRIKPKKPAHAIAAGQV